jgi:hypothetical protein
VLIASCPGPIRRDELRLLAIADCEHVFPEYADMLRRPGNATGPAVQLSTVEYRSKDPLIRVDRVYCPCTSMVATLRTDPDYDGFLRDSGHTEFFDEFVRCG